MKSALNELLLQHCITKRLQKPSKLQDYKGQYNWQGNQFPLAIQKTRKFEKKTRETTANVLFNSKKVCTHVADQSAMESVATNLAHQ